MKRRRFTFPNFIYHLPLCNYDAAIKSQLMLKCPFKVVFCTKDVPYVGPKGHPRGNFQVDRFF